jgi:hypothetical protein
MANLSDQKTLQNKSQVMGPTIIHLDTVSDLDPAAFEGTFAYSSDKKMYFSNGSVWRTTEDPPIKTPNASAPTEDTTTQRQLTLSTFLNSSIYTSYKQIGIIFEISMSPSMKNPIMQKTIYTSDTNKYNLFATDTIPNLKPGDVFYWRGKYLATDGQESGFSKPYAQTFPAFIDAPKPLTGMDQTTNVVSVSDYHSPFGIDNLYPPYQIQWLLSTNADFSSAISIKTDIAASNPLNTITIFPTPDTVYYWKARYYSTPASGGKYSDYSVPGTSKQVRDVITPKIVDVLGATGKTVRLKITPYYSLTNKERLVTEWIIASSADDLDKDIGTVFTSNASTPDSLDIVTLPNTILADSKTIYYWKARYKNVLGTASEYSPGSTFIRYPEVINPKVTTTINTETRSLTISAFSSEYSTIYPYSITEWRVYDNTGTKLIYSEDSTGNTLNIFGHANVILPDGNYVWTARYKNSRGTYTALVRSTNYQIPWISTPAPVTVANGSTDQDALVASAFYSEYGVAPVSSEIIIMDVSQNVLEIIPNNTSPDKINIYTGLRGYSSKLQQGNNYYWKIKYTGYLNGTHVSRYSITSTYTQPLFILTPNITQPVSTDPTGRFEGPQITLQASKFATFTTINSIGDEHISSDWQLSTTPTFDGWDDGTNRTITARLDKDTTFKDTWNITNLLPATTYYARVRYYGNRGYSDWSQVIEFSTLYEYKHFVTLPANYNANPVIGQGYAGGFYAGTMWHNITSSTTSLKLSTVITGQTLSFEVPSMQFNRIVYSGQIVQIRSTNSPRYIQITGKVTSASATTLKILVTNIFKHSSISSNITVSNWSVMTRFRIILAPKAYNNVKLINRSNNVVNEENSWKGFPLKYVDRTVLPTDDPYLLDITSSSSNAVLDWPEDFFNLSDGQAIQTAMYRFSWLYYAWYCTTTTSSTLRGYRTPDNTFPIADYVNTLNNSTAAGLGQYYQDWYCPSRDELQLCFYNLTPTEKGSGTSTLFGVYNYDPTTPTHVVNSVNDSYYRVNLYITIKGNISDYYPTLLDTVNTPVAAPENNFGSNNNSEPYENSFFYSESNTLNASSTLVPYLKLNVPYATRYYFPQSNNINFAYGGTEALNGTYNINGVPTTSSTLYSATCIKTNTTPYEFNNTDIVPTTSFSYKHAPYVLDVSKNITTFGKMTGTYSYSTSPIIRLIRRTLA